MKFIQKIKQLRQQRIQKLQAKMKAEILKALEKFYSDLQHTTGKVDFLPCYKAAIAFKENVKTLDDLKRIYKDLLAYQKRLAA